jgi:cytoskeletal protein RodZ
VNPPSGSYGTPGDVGSKLREARERRHMSLRQVANATKISLAVLESLERNDITRLPGGIFSRAFVRAYAAEVGLDPDQVTQEFIEQFPDDSVTAGHPTSRRFDAEEAHESDRRTASVFVKLVTASIPVALLVIYFGRPARVTPQRVSEPVQSRSAADSVREPPPPAVPPAPAPVAAIPEKAEPSREASPPERLTVVVSSTVACWTTAMADGRRVLDRELQPDERQVLEVSTELVLTGCDGAALNLTLNGARARSLGPPGEVVMVRLTPANFKSYLDGR